MNKSIVPILSFCLVTFIGCSSQVFAYQKGEEISELLGMSLEDFNSVPVYAGTKLPESQQTSSASISLYTHEQIIDYGLYTIADLARITPGYSVANLSDQRGLSTRGFSPLVYDNNRHLLLLDGIPVRHARSARIPVQEEMPLFFADRVEFLRGPSSVIYGSGAINGVVNVMSLEPTSSKGIEARLNTGSRDSIWQGMANAWWKSDLGTTTMSLGVFDREASKQQIDAENFPEWLNNNRRDAQFLYLKHKVEQGVAEGLSLGLIFSRLSSGMGEGNAVSRTQFNADNDITWEYLIPYLKFERGIGTSSSFSSYLSYNRSLESGITAFRSSSSLQDTRFRSYTEAFELQSEISSKLAPNTHLRVGANLDLRRERGQPDSYVRRVRRNGQVIPFPTLFAETSSWFRDAALFVDLQQNWDFLAGTTLTAGLRFTDIEANELRSQNLSPRVSLVQRLNQEWTLRFIGSQAFRSANLKEVGFNQEVINRFNLTTELPLVPELITTFEVGLGYQKSRFNGQLNLFSNNFEDEIIRSRVDFGNFSRSVYMNSPGDNDSLGGEIIISSQLSDGLIASGSYSYNNPDGGNEAFLKQIIPRHSANLILRYRSRFFNKPSSLVVINRWQSGFSAPLNPEWDIGSQFNTDVNFRLELNRNLTFELQVENLLDRDNRIPTSNNNGLPDQELTLYGSILFNYD